MNITRYSPYANWAGMEANETGGWIAYTDYIAALEAVKATAKPAYIDTDTDDIFVDLFAEAMKAKLAEKRAEGIGGWDDPEHCHIDYLYQLLDDQYHARAVLDPVDIANLSMMIFHRKSYGGSSYHGR